MSVNTPEEAHFASSVWESGGHESIDLILSAHPRLKDILARYSSFHTAAIWGGLLTMPELQSNCFRLEALAHLTLAFSKGKEKPTANTIAAWFSQMSDGPCGHAEDAAEDVFVSYITTPEGGFRVLEGMWESAGFYLQRIVNVVNGMPRQGVWLLLRNSVYAMLRLSDAVCERSNVGRYSAGNKTPEVHLRNDVLSNLQSIRQRVTFTESDIQKLGISSQSLEPFLFDCSLCNVIPRATLSRSPLVDAPILRRDSLFVVALPTAISATIRELVIGSLIDNRMHQPLVEALASEYQDYFQREPVLDNPHGAPIFFRPNGPALLAEYGLTIDQGRLFHVIFVLDSLSNISATGIGGFDSTFRSTSSVIDESIAEFRRQMHLKHVVREGLTLIVNCGVGRGTIYVSNLDFNDWHVLHVTAPDISTLGLLGDVTPLTLIRLVDAEERLENLGSGIFNINGLLNLIAWMRSLSGHLVPHRQLANDSAPANSHFFLAPSTLHDLRVDEKQRIDRCCIQNIDGKWIEVRRSTDSLFEEDNLQPIYYAYEQGTDYSIPFAFVSKARTWWCKVGPPGSRDDWKTLTQWIARFARVLDDNLSFLPTGPLELLVRFLGHLDDSELPKDVTKEEIRAGIRVNTDVSRRRVSIEVDEMFVHGLANPKNISELSLMDAIVDGFLAFHPEVHHSLKRVVLEQIVPDELIRDRHFFYAQHFRDFVRESLPRKPVVVDSLDNTTLRLGLGWRAREREDGPKVSGKTQCTSFLNSLVKQTEERLCAELKKYNRLAFVKRALANHESAFLVHQRWRQTAAANLSLHADREATLRVMADQEFKNNGVQLASRVLNEAAICECQLEGGLVPGDLDLARLIAQVLLVVRLGEWSDGIHREVIAPTVLISPLGELHLDESFFNDVVRPFGDESHARMVHGAIGRYPEHFADPTSFVEEPSTTEVRFEADFEQAWVEECGFTIDQCTQFLFEVCKLGRNRKQAVFEVRKSELVGFLAETTPGSEQVLSGLTMLPRATWRLPDQPVDKYGLVDKDRQPWRFRRRMSVLRRPILQLDDSADPLLVLAPGLIEQSILYILRNYHQGYYHVGQLQSPKMRSWSGYIADKRGKAFSGAVADRMTELGWKVKRELSIRTIIGLKTPIDYGDVDVLAWNESTCAVLLIECKDLHFHKTAGELADQLSGYRGKEIDGKRDYLLKHMDRCRVLAANSTKLAQFLGLTLNPQIQGQVVFRNHVPMLHVWKDLGTDIKFLTFRDLETV